MCSDNSGDTLADLESALGRLAAEDTKAMFGPQVLDQTARLVRAQNRLALRSPARSAKESSRKPPRTMG
jgi:hypothetical protein